jgi:hypothetical protein
MPPGAAQQSGSGYSEQRWVPNPYVLQPGSAEAQLQASLQDLTLPQSASSHPEYLGQSQLAIKQEHNDGNHDVTTYPMYGSYSVREEDVDSFPPEMIIRPLGSSGPYCKSFGRRVEMITNIMCSVHMSSVLIRDR